MHGIIELLNKIIIIKTKNVTIIKIETNRILSITCANNKYVTWF